MTALKRRIAALIEADGPIGVDAYMTLCLSDPEHGYYSTREPFGRGGDFITAPEISQMFGELIGAWLASAWHALGGPADPLMVEIGPGRGTLFADMLRTLEKLAPDLLAGADLRLVETSARLAKVQKATLGRWVGRITWEDRVEDLPDRPLFIVGNEIFDALPVRQFVKLGGSWRERMIGMKDSGKLHFVARPAVIELGLLPPGSEHVQDGKIVEIAPARSALMANIATHIAMHGGCGLFFDYGPFERGFGDTLQAVRKHRYEDVLKNPGEADLTSHVDFAELSTAARRQGLKTAAMTQGAFLFALGLLERAGALGADADENRRAELHATVERLAGADQMGDLFKVLAILPAGATIPPFEAAGRLR